MSYLKFEKALMTNLQESLPRELLRTNRSGAYSCSTVVECNTRKYHGLLVERTPESKKLDLDLSEAPSMTACGQLGIDRTFVPVPGEENLYFLYNKYQEEWHLQNDKEMEEWERSRDTEPIVIIPKENIQIHSRSMIIRLDSAGIPEDLRDGDFEKAKTYLHRMSHNDKIS